MHIDRSSSISECQKKKTPFLSTYYRATVFALSVFFLHEVERKVKKDTVCQLVKGVTKVVSHDCFASSSASTS